MSKELLSPFVVLLAAIGLSAQPVPPPAGAGRSPGPANRPAQFQPRPGPWTRNLEMLRSPDGLAFAGRELFVERAGVPCFAQDGKGRLIAVFQWFPFDRREAFDHIGVKFSGDGGKTWTEPRAVEFGGLPPEYDRQFDPTIVVLEDGRYRLYFTSHGRGENTAIYSALSSDGLDFTFEPGRRFGADAENVVDCSVAKLGDRWHLFAPLPRQEGRGFHAVSRDGLTFERQRDVSVPGRGTWIGNVVATSAGLRFYGSGEGGVWSAASTDGATWRKDEGVRAPGGDPAVWRLNDGSYLMAVTGEPRSDARMNPPWRQETGPLAGTGPPGPPEFGDFTPGNAAITANAEFVFVLRNNTVYQFNAQTLEFVRQTPLPPARGGLRRPPRGPDRGLPRLEPVPREP